MIVHLGAKHIDPSRALEKRDLLLFDRIVTAGLSQTLASLQGADAAALEWLASEGCVQDFDLRELSAKLPKVAEGDFLFAEKAAVGIILQHVGLTLERYQATRGGDSEEHRWVAVVGRENHVDYAARMIASHYRDHPTIRAAPLISHFSSMDVFHLERNAERLLHFLTSARSEYESALRSMPSDHDFYLAFYEVAIGTLDRMSKQNEDGDDVPLERTEVVQIIMEEFPMPDEGVPWEQILDYRRDPDSQARLQWLRAWMKKITEADFSEREIRDEYHELLFAFNDHMRVHRMKVQSGGIQALWTVPASVLENVIRLRFTKIPEALFWTKHQQIALLEAERAAPGRELAYVVTSQKKFGR